MTNLLLTLSMPHSLRFFPYLRLNPFKTLLIPNRRQLPTLALCQTRSELAFTSGAHLIPHPAKVNSNPQVLLMKAHAATSSVGSATVIVAMLEKNGILNIANIGDCGLRIIRKGRVVFSTCPQEHYFDCPYQLSSEEASQTYDDAMVCSFKLSEGDTVVVGSDGLFDNVFDHEIISTVSKLKNVSEAAKGLAELANAHSTDVDFDSPYSLEARSRGFDVPFWKKILGQRLTGGKPDDITVIIGHVISL